VGKTQSKRLKEMTAPQLRDLRARLKKTQKMTDIAFWELQRRVNNAWEVKNNLWKLIEKTEYWEGKLIGEHCPARERCSEPDTQYYTCHCRSPKDSHRTLWFKDFYPQCIGCKSTHKEKIEAGVFERIINEKK